MSDRPWIAPRYASLFLWSRPAIPWDIADKISTTLKESGIRSVGVSGSLHPSVLVSAAYGDPDRRVNAFSFSSCWDEASGWNYVIEDSPGMEKTHPYTNVYLPIPDNQLTFWDGATPFFESEALFIDLPFTHKSMRLKLSSLRDHYKLLMFGFLDSFPGPTDVYQWALSKGYLFEEVTASLTNSENAETREYKICIGVK